MIVIITLFSEGDNKTYKVKLRACHGVLLFLCRSVSWLLYGPFCHGAHKLDISTLFTTQGRRRQLKSGTAKLCLRTNLRGVWGHAPLDILFSLYRYTRIFTLFRFVVLHI